MEDRGFELGWGFYLIIIPLVLNVVMRLFVKPFFIRLRDRINENSIELEKIKKWLKNF